MKEQQKGSVLIVDDEEHIRDIIEAALSKVVGRCFTAANAQEGLECLRENNIDLVVSDIQMPEMSGLEFLKQVSEEQPRIRFLMVTAFASIETVVQALRYGASDFITKPFENEELRQVVSRILAIPSESPVSGSLSVSEEIVSGSGIIGNSLALKTALKTLQKAALTHSTVLLLGESGTGKDVFARALHALSSRAHKPYIPINCGALPAHLVEAELFGHEKGAYTGASEKRPGKFTLAHTGTLFLDEVGELPLDVQVKLLRVLQDRIVEPLGGGKSQSVDIRLIAATNRDLSQSIADGRFREDLFYRLNIIPIHLPPLRERGDDIIKLAQHFLRHFCQRYDMHYTLSPQEEKYLLTYSWPGNVRELENVMERAVVLGEGGKLALVLPQEDRTTVNVVPSQSINAPRSSSPSTAATEDTLSQQRKEKEKEIIYQSLERNRWNKTRTAEELKISRRGLLYKIKEYGIE